MSFSILGLGTVVVDHQVILPCLPAPDTKSEIISDSLQVGGPVPTALALLAIFGIKTSFIGRWSTDQQGDIIKSDLEMAISLCLSISSGLYFFNSFNKT